MTASRNTELFRASGLTLNSNSDTVTAGTTNVLNGSTSGLINTEMISNGLLVVNAANAPTGTNPGLAIFVDAEDGFGNWCLVSNSTAISGAVLTTSGVVYGNISASYQLTNLARIRWVLTGTNPSFTGVTFSLFGR